MTSYKMATSGWDGKNGLIQIVPYMRSISEWDWYCLFEFHCFVDLRKESRKLENEIDAKVVSFTKLASAYSQKDHEQ